jgi:hypothetical protein
MAKSQGSKAPVYWYHAHLIADTNSDWFRADIHYLVVSAINAHLASLGGLVMWKAQATEANVTVANQPKISSSRVEQLEGACSLVSSPPILT